MNRSFHKNLRSVFALLSITVALSLIPTIAVRVMTQASYEFSVSLYLAMGISMLFAFFVALRVARTVQDYQKDLDEKDFAELVINSINDYMFVVKPDGRLTRVNTKAESELGYNVDEFETLTIQKLIRVDPTETNPTGHLSLFAAELTSAAAVLVKKDLSEVPVLVSSAMIEKNRNVLGVVCIAKDVSELKSASDEREKLIQKLSQASKLASLGTLGAGVAHELNNPLVAVKGFAQILDQKYGQLDGVRDTAYKILYAAERMQKIIDHLRSFARQSNAQDWQPISIPAVIENTLMIAGKQLETRNIGVSLVLDDAIPQVMGDSNELESVFHNLISNSRDAFCDVNDNRTKSITIKVTEEADNHLLIHYQDNASGIETHTSEQIFDPFFTTKDIGQGTGLGMTIVYDIVQKHSGTIDFSSEVNVGTIFTIRLPTIANSHQVTDRQAWLDAPTKTQNRVVPSIKPSLLIVDDEPYVLEVLEEFLAMDFAVSVFSDPRKAIEDIKHNHYDLVISDLRMPHTTGLDVLGTVREFSPHTVTILSTGQASDEPEVMDALNTVADEIMSKPFAEPNKVIEFVFDCLKKHQRAA